MLELINIHKTYTAGGVSTEVLKGISMKFRRNEFTSILGPSGCGKTTLLNIIGGLDQYTDGDLLIEGISTKKYRDSDWDTYRNYRVGFIFQSYNLIMHQSVLANVEMALTLSGVSRGERKKRAIEALKKVGLGDQINKKPNQLSGGQMQRVSIARALVNNPEIILADEPTGALDSKTSIQIMNLLKEIASDKLVIMVTHNPEIAKNYSTRILEMKDGLIVGDSNPYTEDEAFAEQRVTRKTSMSFLTSLALSFRNLLTKKGRTLLTAFAGSIGIIGIALVLSLSNGVNNLAKGLEKEALTDYPITIEKTSFDLFGIISTISTSEKDEGCEVGKICSRDDLVRSTVISDDGLVKKNDLKGFKKYIDSAEDFRTYTSEINYSYNLTLQVYDRSYNKVNPTPLQEGSAANQFKELPESEDRLGKYTVLAGRLPENENEAVLVIGSDGTINDSLIYSLGMRDMKQLSDDLAAIAKDESYTVKSVQYSPEDFTGRSYKIILNTDYYDEENGIYIDRSNDQNYMKEKIDAGTDLTITGVIQAEDSETAYIGYTHALTDYLIRKVSGTDLYKAQTANKEVNVLTGQPFDGLFNTYDDVVEELGLFDEDDPSSISLYPNDFESKQKIIEMIDAYNAQQKDAGNEAGTIKYTDMMSSMLGSVTNIVNIISWVLIAFIAISLIVSSIMISIITYISVLERTREIGILRAIGASKKDIVRVFRAETIIEGLAAGVMGILITLGVNVIANIILQANDLPPVAELPWLSGGILILLSVVLNVIAGSAPSGIAAKKNPVEALRTE